jgi:23S rRNA (guanosine2251-2'-O)-methyltransferase
MRQKPRPNRKRISRSKPARPQAGRFEDRSRSHRTEADPLIPIVGKRPVEELLRLNFKPEKLLVLARERHGKEAQSLAPYQEAGWKIEELERPQLDLAAEGLHHQGFVALIRHFPFIHTSDLIKSALAQPQPLVVALDEVQDAGNLGAILRSAECAGAAGAVIPVHRAASVTAAVVRASAGAALHLPLARSVNLGHALEEFTEAGFRIFGADQEGAQSLYETDLTGPVVLVIGSEGRGLRPGIKRRCQALISIPISGRTASLNASVAAAVCLYEALRQRLR